MSAIAELNDLFRKGDMTLGYYRLTQGVQELELEKKQQLIQLVADFDAFTPSNDPSGEHDFGKIVLDEEEYFFKIDYYDPTLTYHSPDPASVCATRRVMTLMCRDEY